MHDPLYNLPGLAYGRHVLQKAQPYPSALDVPICSPKDWEQLDDPGEIEQVLDRLRQATRFEVYRRPELYELAYPGYAGDVDFYCEKGRTGKVLYLGVGTGRLFGPLADENPAAVGIERSSEMRALFQERNPSLSPDRVLLADAVEAEIPTASFDTVLAPYSFLQVVDRASLPQLLTNIHRWLRPGGRLYADTFSPYLIPFRHSGIEFNIRQLSEQVRISIYVIYDHLAQAMRELALIDENGSRQVLEMDLAYYLPQELVAQLTDAGFSFPQITGGYHGEPFDPQENEVLVYEAAKHIAGDDLPPAHPSTHPVSHPPFEW
jgi:SAM-dependent methyltransferase